MQKNFKFFKKQDKLPGKTPHQQNLNQEYYDRHCAPHQFIKNQWVLLKSKNFAHKNRKLAEKYKGPNQIVKLIESNNVEIKINRKRN